MASLRKHPNSPYWIACFTDSNRIRTTRTTKTKSRSTALKMAVEWENAAKLATAGKLTESQARTVINSIMEHAGLEPVTFYKTRDWLTEWLADKKLSSQATTYQKYEPIITRFLKHLGTKANEGLPSLTPANIRSFRELLSKEGRGANTVNHIISKVISAPLTKAVTLGYMPLNPCKAMEPLTETDSKAGTFTLDQIADLLRLSPSPDWRGLILAGFYTGQRLRDLADLTWEQIDLSARIITIQQGKTDVEVAIPIHQDFLDFLLEIGSSDDPKAPVFRTIYVKAGGGKSGLSETFKRIMIKAKIELKKRTEATGVAGRGRNTLSFHSLRHSFNSAMANAGVAQEVRQKLTGHRDADTNKLYTHLDLPALKTAVESVPSVKGNKSKS